MVFEGISTYHDQLVRGITTVRAEVLRCLERAHSQSHLNAFLELFDEEALERADALDLEVQAGTLRKLSGVVVGIKDNICYQGHQVSAASRILEGFQSLYSATVVERLLENGAIILGRLNCDEFAMGSSNENSAYGPVLNPRNTSCVPGGSSGGSAAAVAMGACHLSLGTDTGGSVRQPAAYCGVVGMKPTYGRISRHGIIAFASSFDQVGVFGHTVEDVALLTTCIAGMDGMDSTCTAPQGENLASEHQGKTYKIAYAPGWMHHPSLHPSLHQHLEAFLQRCVEQGHIPVYYILATAEASSNLSRYSGMHYGKRDDHADSLESTLKLSRSSGFGPEVQRRIMLGTFVLSEGYYDAYYGKAQKVRRLLKERFERIMQDCDILAMPTTVGPAFPLGSKSSDPLAMY
ncbi:MAG: Asp-tRNA(Asn)/Glu-tRNA(Gln) amidotransferase subunit GatA, partial [Sphingobacteriia bacterium]|nr:Asp-tRNA(Asn)/Glu-tRNA(Gln) amidotransferase subunit GatA [Sphingobacteriia bacterium]